MTNYPEANGFMRIPQARISVIVGHENGQAFRYHGERKTWPHPRVKAESRSSGVDFREHARKEER